MTDAILVRPKNKTWDFTIAADGGIETESFFDTAILTSLYEEKRASSSEVERPELRRGWIGNESTPDFERGSKLWLFSQSRLTRSVINGIISAANEALAWLVEQDYALSVTSDVELSNGTVNLLIQLERPDGQIDKRLLPLWDRSGITETE